MSSQGDDRVSPLSGRMTTSQAVGTEELGPDGVTGQSDLHQPQLPTDTGNNMMNGLLCILLLTLYKIYPTRIYMLYKPDVY